VSPPRPLTRPKLLPRSFYRRDPVDLAPLLLNKLIAVSDGRSARIVEVEAYRGTTDPASHAFRGRTASNATMFGRPGRLYVYRSYGLHWCANVVAGHPPADGVPFEAGAVLLRAGEPVGGIEQMRSARWRTQLSQRDLDLCRGPGRLCQALGVDGPCDGLDLARPGSAVVLLDDGTPPPLRPSASPRVGVSAGVDLPWRFALAGHPYVSGPRPAAP